MSVADEVLRTVLEEYIAPGGGAPAALEKQLAARLPMISVETRDAAIAVAKEAVDTAWKLAREYDEGTRSQKSVEAELERRYPWLLLPDKPPAGMSWWDRLSWSRRSLVRRLGGFGYYLAIM